MNPTCPHCEQPLTVERTGRGVSVFCPWGDCLSEACNLGATERSTEEAVKTLEKLYEGELGGNPKAKHQKAK